MTEFNIRDNIEMDDDTREIIAELKQAIQSMSKDISYLTKGFERVEQCYVTKTEFSPVKTVVYSLVGMICVAVVGAILALVVIK